jgi:acid phosphatase type 7
MNMRPTRPGPLRAHAAPHFRTANRLFRAAAAAILLSAWMVGSSVSSAPVAAARADPVIAAAGDIACDPTEPDFNGGNGMAGVCQQQKTADILTAGHFAAVLPLGDVQYFCGSAAAFQASYDLSWGKVKSITHPVVGNHEYLTSGGTGCDSTNAGAAGYYGYFGSAAGTPGQGYYSYNIGAWHLIALNSSCVDIGGCTAASPQGLWLAADLASHPQQCTLAYWHIPLFSSGGRASIETQPLWDQLYAAHADLVLDGHDHIYERFDPQTPAGLPDPVNGIREITVGTGGANHTAIAIPAANSVVADTTTFGVLELTLHQGSYDWKFVPAVGSFTDSGSAACHDPATGPTATPTPAPTPARPGQPSAVTAAPASQAAIVAWIAPANAGASPITSYTVTSSPDGKTCTTAGLSCTVAGLTPGQPYTFTVTAASVQGAGPPSRPSAAVTPIAGATYVPITPTRILDTRNGTGGLPGPLSVHLAKTFQVSGGSSGVPANATAVTGNLTVTEQTAEGYFFLGPTAMDYPTSSTLNFPAGDNRANAVTVALGPGGTLSVTYVTPSAGATAHVVFDVTGYFVPDASGAFYKPLTPARLLDTRNGTGGLSGPVPAHVAETFQVAGGSSPVPAGAVGVTGNLTVTEQTGEGWLFVGPTPQDNPTSSTLNFPIGDNRANAVTVALGANGTLSVTYGTPVPGATTHVVFDVTGYFDHDPAGVTFVPLTPSRILDTRNGTGGIVGPIGSSSAVPFGVAGAGGVPATATAVTGNLTVTEQTSRGYLFLGPDPMGAPTSSTLNFPAGDNRANAVTVALGSGGTLAVTCVAPVPGQATQVVFDVSGYFTP